MKYKKCIICGFDEFRYLVSSEDKYGEKGKKFYVLRCIKCGYSFTYLPSGVELNRLYPPGYRQGKKGLARFQRRIYFIYYGLFFPLRFFPEKGEVLDLGCGNGLLAAFLSNRGYKVTCVESRKESARFVSETFSLQVFNCELKDAGFQTGQFDVVIMRHSIEHVVDLPSTLVEISRILADGGMLFIEAPNINSAEFAFFKANWYHLDLPRHIHHLSPKILRELLGKYNYSVRYSGFDNFMPHSYSMSFVYLPGEGINRRMPCIIEKAVLLILYPLSLAANFLASRSGRGSIMRIMAVKER